MIEPLLIAQLDAAQIQHRILHRHRHFLAFAGLRAADQRGQQADRQVHSGIAVTQRRPADCRRAIPESCGRGGAAGALRDVVINLEVRVGRTLAEALDRAENEPRVEFLNMLPGEAHPVHRTGREILDQHVGLADQLLQDRLAFRRLGVQGQRLFVAIERDKVQRIQIGDVPQLVARHVPNARPLDLQHVCAEPRQQLRACGSRLYAGKVDNFDSFEW